MERIAAFLLIFLAGCNSNWRAGAMNDAEAIVRQHLNDPSIQFKRVQFTGDQQTGQTCGYFEQSTASGGRDEIRFIVFIDGAGGQNPYIDDPSAPYPKNKRDFALNWQTQCIDLGYSTEQK